MNLNASNPLQLARLESMARTADTSMAQMAAQQTALYQEHMAAQKANKEKVEELRAQLAEANTRAELLQGDADRFKKVAVLLVCACLCVSSLRLSSSLQA